MQNSFIKFLFINSQVILSHVIQLTIFKICVNAMPFSYIRFNSHDMHELLFYRIYFYKFINL